MNENLSAGRNRLPSSDIAHDQFSSFVYVDVKVVEHTRRNAVSFTQQPEEQVLVPM